MSATQELLRFGIFELNLATEELRKSGTPVKLAPLPFKLLALLASHAGQIVTRQEIQEKLWGAETFVDFDQSVNKCIKQIRTALNDNADNPLYIETLPRHGYRFLAPVVSKTIAAPGPKVVESKSGELPRLPVLIGRGASAPARAAALAPSYPAALPERLEPRSEAAHIHPSRFRLWRVRLVWVGVAVMVVALICGGLYWRAHKTPALTEKDTIVLADFDNKTGDPVFDGALREGISAQLEQSPFLSLLSDDRITQTLALMAKPRDARLTHDLAREVCVRTACAATIEGSISGLGSQYVLGLKAVSCHNDELIADEQVTADDKEHIIVALGAASTKLRKKLGESLASVQKYDAPLENVTTPSLEALRAFGLGWRTLSAKGGTTALPLFERAAELDPNFAMAYYAMAFAYSSLGESGRAAENARKAYDLREKVSERERFAIEASYYLIATGELEKAAQVYELWQQTYPRSPVSYGILGGIHSSLGNEEEALGEYREAVLLDPNVAISYTNLGVSYMALNQLNEAGEVYRQAEERKLEGEYLLQSRYELAFLKGDTAQMAKLVSVALGKPGTEDMLLESQADTEAWYGKLKNARELTGRAMHLAMHNDAKETAAGYQVEAALWEVESGNREQARAGAEAAVKLAPNRDVRAMAALVLARAGDTARAEKLAAELEKIFPLDTLIQRYRTPTIRAASALQQKDPNRAIELLKGTIPTELGDQGLLLPVYLRGEAYLMLHDGNAAACASPQSKTH